MGGCTRVLEHCKRKSIHHTASALTYGIVSHVSKLGEGASSLPVSFVPIVPWVQISSQRDGSFAAERQRTWSFQTLKSCTGKCTKGSRLSNRFMLCFEKVWAWCAMLRLCADRL